MRIGVAQLRPVAGDIGANLRKHLSLLELAISLDAQLLCFPELSLTGYEPKLAASLATHQKDARLDALQDLAGSTALAIAVGIPTAAPDGTRISMIVLRPDQPRVTYSKQQLHDDELPYFTAGDQQIILEAEGHLIAPAICYESLQDSHVDAAADLGADIYLTSVAKTVGGVGRAFVRYPEFARRHAMTVLMANSVGPSDDFVAAGRSAIWNARGELLVELDDQQEGVALLDLATGQVRSRYL